MRKRFEIWGWRPRICKKCEITRTIYWNSERPEQFLVTECFFNLILEASQTWDILKQLKLEKNIGIEKHAGKVRKTILHYCSLECCLQVRWKSLTFFLWWQLLVTRSSPLTALHIVKNFKKKQATNLKKKNILRLGKEMIEMVKFFYIEKNLLISKEPFLRMCIFEKSISLSFYNDH